MLAVTIAAVGIVILAYSLLAPQDTADDSHMGMRASYSSTGVALILLAAVLIVAGIALALAYQEYEPVPPNWVQPKMPQAVTPLPPSADTPRAQSTEVQEKELADAGDLGTEEENYLVLRLLTGDERHMFKAIMDSGGEALQKDLILRTKMSNAKVSRLLDKLTQKGIISKERYGATNRVKIQLKR